MKKVQRVISNLVAATATLIASTSVSVASPPFSAYQPKAPKSLIKVD